MRRLENKNQLVEYFKKNFSKNYPEDSLKFALLNQGYSRTAIEQAVVQAHKEIAETAPVLREKPVIKYEVFDEKNNLLKLGHSKFWKKIKVFFKG
ncbi:hypothetical protein COT60_02900 [Candidatus Pacearchaeota archaeon CG09_land_8_20_14_0_10_30_9]|nr:MAG: hypothetical protein QJ16_C0002G0028 [archaeon GW2011_AR1]MBS3077960.1 hypothetical protein [Candidatus Pacearchaeota archaeon]OIO40796.1 MAG: hypothetical protein AUJ61_01105 [Candidatus Pacearchaeota archaeon CG1_02_30_18]PIO00977.1 MAG: hypothetical protein COT60_02900 [Candidatus Pacearchaeota archaeon CG09_land_8_20_14_0_10_30_9]HIH52369.1 hypothetical protein [Nanoarchaeota archaeon]